MAILLVKYATYEGKNITWRRTGIIHTDVITKDLVDKIFELVQNESESLYHEKLVGIEEIEISVTNLMNNRRGYAGKPSDISSDIRLAFSE